ncbi:VOC family protein [Terrarubrum flagellatum]|uniref:VOC family protein n=1 Tax=Terrirubrum flagellatum TaxID=2895980 RepID=UPI0031455B89
MPNLDNLRKQAKQFLRWHRDKHHPVAAEIRTALPRFQNLSDHQILDAPFKLGDAQELVARKLGYESWTALKAGLSAMPDDKALSPKMPLKPDIGAAEAMVYVADFQRARDFYIRKLGFTLKFAYGEPPFYGLVERDRARLCLRLVCEPVFAGDIREREQLLSAAFTVDSAAKIKALFLEFQMAAVDFLQPLKTEPWGARDFIIRDLDGNLILFAGPATDV